MNALGNLCVKNYNRDSDARVVGTLRGTDNLNVSVKENSLDSSYLEISKLKDKQRRILDIVNNNLFDLMIPGLYKELRDASNRYYSKICDRKELKLD